MQEAGTEWVVVLKGDKLLGWIDWWMMEGGRNVGDVEPREFAAIVTPGSSLRTALDIIVTSRTHVAVVVDDENRYQGIVTLDRLTAELRP
jgi:CBS domain-containing protein